MKKISSTILVGFFISLLWVMTAIAQKVDVTLWKTLSGHPAWVWSVAFSPDGKLLASGSLDNTIKLWDVASGQAVKTLSGHSFCVWSVAFSPDGLLLASGSSDQTIKLWDVASGQVVKTLSGHSDLVFWSVAFSPDGKLLASGSGDKTIKLWDIASGQEVKTLSGHSDRVWSVAFSPDGKLLASGSGDNTSKLWDVASGQVVKTLSGHSFCVWSVAFSPDGLLLASGSSDQTIKLWDVASGQVVKTLSGHTGGVSSVAFSPDGTLLASGSGDNTIKLWDVASGQEVRTLSGHTGEISSVVFSPNGNLLASGSLDKTIKLWQIEGGARTQPQMAAKPKLPPQLTASLAFSDPSGNQVLDAEERGKITLSLRNSGQGEAYRLQVKATPEPASSGVTIEQPKLLDRLAVGGSTIVEIPVQAAFGVASGAVRLKVEVAEANGFDLDPPEYITFNTKAFQPPKLELADVGINDASGNGQIEPSEIVEITARLQNRGVGEARNVRADVQLGANVYQHPESKLTFDLGSLAPGAPKDITFSIFTNNKAISVPVTVKISEAHPQYNVSLPLDLAFNRPQKRANELVVQSAEKPGVAAPELAALSVDVDQNLPRAAAPNPDAFAVIIGNRNYHAYHPDVPNVDYALRDAAVMKEYLIKTLGYKEGNILYRTDATNAVFRGLFGTETVARGELYNLVKPGKSDVFIYYSGHGAPDVQEKRGYFVPVDCSPAQLRLNGYALDLLYENLRKIPARSFTIVIEACFSGGSQEGMLIAAASPVGIQVLNPALQLPNGVVFTSSSGDEISSWYPEKQHSLFTYFFLRGLQGAADADGNGEITAGELRTYLSDPAEGVPYYARALYHGRQQTPGVTGSLDRLVRGQVKAQ